MLRYILGGAVAAGLLFTLHACTQLESQVPMHDPAVHLTRAYVTTAAKGGVAELFDGNPGTYWETPAGSGENEGIMIYFPEPTFIRQVNVQTARGDFAVPERFELYADGSFVDSGKDNLEVGAEVSNLFLRISEVAGSKRITTYANGAARMRSAAPSGKGVAIAELEIIGDHSHAMLIQPPVAYSGSVTASSTLKPESGYHASYLFDSRLDFAWAEGASGKGEGQRLNFHFDQAISVQGLAIWNGYQRSESHFKSNARVKAFTFGPKGGEMKQYELGDVQGPQIVMLPSILKGQDYELKVVSVYPGGSYQDLLISELRFIHNQSGQLIEDPYTEKAKGALRGQISGTVLGDMVNRNLREQRADFNSDLGQYYMNRSLSLRDNGSFVMYLSDAESVPRKGGGSPVTVMVERVADGGWEIIEVSKDKAKVKIYGKINRIVDRDKMYGGDVFSDMTRIFKDELVIDRHSVKGARFLDSLSYAARSGDLVDMGSYLNSATIDLRYATEDNFMNEMMYGECQPCLLRYEVASDLEKAAEWFRKKGYTLHFWDCLRPVSAQKRMWEKIKDPRYVADPNNGGSNHNRGVAVDITLEKGGKLLDMGTEYDHFGEEAHLNYGGLTPEQKANRDLLQEGMKAAGFVPLATEWWHFSHPSKSKYGFSDEEVECEY